MNDTKIIGGEFCINTDALEHEQTNPINPAYSLGRSCLYAILKAIKKNIQGGVLLPDYLCRSIAEVPHRLNISVKHYHISPLLTPDFKTIKQVIKKCHERMGIVLISYYGMVDLDDVITSIRSENPELIIIVDDVQNFFGFAQHVDYDYCFTSYRKWFAVPDGADIKQKEGLPKVEFFSQQSRYALYKTAGNLLKNHTRMIGDSVSLELINKGENMMDDEYCYTCSAIGRNLFQRIDFEETAKKRKRNAKILHEGLKEINIQHLYNPNQIPLFIPIIIQNRNQVRKSLFSNSIFSPVHWPVEDAQLQGDNELYHTELSLICDQRYDEEDMERIVREIKNAM